MIKSNEAPLYLSGMITYIVVDAVCIVFLLICRHLMAKSNRERLAGSKGKQEPNTTDDLTDREDPNFIYRL